MSTTFTKLFSSITESTVWQEAPSTRLVWITMLAMSDRVGRVWASVPGLAHRARVSVEDTRVALERLLAPDPDSRTPDHEGRRIEAIDGGWRLLNYLKYRAVRDEEAIKESKRKYINTRRAVENVELGRTDANKSRHNTEAEAEADLNAITTNSREEFQNHSGGPTLADVLAWASMDGVDMGLAELFWNWYESTGWVDSGQNAIVRPRNRLAVWKSKAQAKGFIDKQGKAVEGGGFWKAKARFDLIRAELKAMRDRGLQNPDGGVTLESKDKENYARLVRQLRDVRKELDL